MTDFSELSDRERWEYLFAMFKEGKAPRAGRPKKNSDVLKWRDLGLTRKDAWRMRRLSEIPAEDFEAFCEWRLAQRKRPSYRSVLAHFGKINVPTENDFDGTPLGDLAAKLLEPCERLAGQLSNRDRRILKRGLFARLQQIFRKTRP